MHETSFCLSPSFQRFDERASETEGGLVVKENYANKKIEKKERKRKAKRKKNEERKKEEAKEKEKVAQKNNFESA